eukprot:g5801.t1
MKETEHLYAQLLHMFNVIDSKRLENDFDESLKKGCFQKQDVADLLKLAGYQMTGKYKLKKVKSIDDAFQEMDKTGTGFVSHEEFVLWYCSQKNVEPPKDYVEHMKILQEEARKGLSDETFDVEKKIRYLFNEIDEDHSGTLTKKQVGKLAKQMGAKLTTLFSHKKLDKAFAEMDANNDGEVTAEEFIEWHHRNHPTEPKHLYAQLLHLFDEIDIAHKEALNKKNVSKLLKLVGNHITGKYKLKKTKSTKIAFQEMDSDHNGFVSNEEFVLWYCSHHNIEPPKDYEEKRGLHPHGHPPPSPPKARMSRKKVPPKLPTRSLQTRKKLKATLVKNRTSKKKVPPKLPTRSLQTHKKLKAALVKKQEGKVEKFRAKKKKTSERLPNHTETLHPHGHAPPSPPKLKWLNALKKVKLGKAFTK